MGSFELMGAMQLLAIEGKQELARVMLRALGSRLGRLLRAANRDTPPSVLLP